MTYSITDLIRYLVDQIAADGDEGSSIVRLNEFLDAYPGDGSTVGPVALDQDVRNFLIATVVEHPDIHVVQDAHESQSQPNGKARASGQGGTGKGKSKRRTKEDEQEDTGGGRAQLPDLKQLVAKHGDQVRLAASERAIANALTGMREVNPTQRRVLVHISRMRGKGASFPELGAALKMTPQTVFFHCKALIDLGLVIKTRNNPTQGITVSHAVATRFAHLSPLLQADQTIHLGDAQGDDDNSASEVKVKQENVDEDGAGDPGAEDVNALPLEEVSQDAFDRFDQSQQALADGETHDDQGYESEQDEIKPMGAAYTGAQDLDSKQPAQLLEIKGILAFPEIKDPDAILALSRDKHQIRLRTLRLVYESPNRVTVSHGLVYRLGPRCYTRLQRRRLRTEVHPMVEEGLLEFVAGKFATPKGDALVKCLQITPKGISLYNELSSPKHKRVMRQRRQDYSSQLTFASGSEMVLEIPLERQLLEIVARTRSAGTTVEALNTAMSGNDEQKRVVVRILDAAAAQKLPQYDDLRLFSALEQTGRVRNARFWTQLWSSALPNTGSAATPMRLETLCSPVAVPLEVICSSTDECISGVIGTSNEMGAKASKRKSLPGGSGAGTPLASQKPRGRPRKHFTEEGFKKADQYRVRIGLPPLTEEEKQGLSTAKGARTSVGNNNVVASPALPPNKRQKTFSASAPLLVDPALAGAERAEDSNERSQEDHSTSQSALSLPQDTTSAVEGSSQVGEPPMAKDRLSHAQEDAPQMTGTPEQPQPNNNGQLASNKPEERLGKINLTMKFKYEKLLEFFQSVEIIESKKVDRAYTDYIREAVPLEKRPTYEMDRKVRNRIISIMLRHGDIQTRQTVGPRSDLPKRKSGMVTLYHVKAIDSSAILAYTQKVLRGETDVFRTARGSTWKESEIVEVGEDVGLPNQTLFTSRAWLYMMATSFTELLSDPRYRQEFVENDVIRSHYTGRIAGLAARMHFVHNCLWNLLTTNVKGGDAYLLVDKNALIVNMDWWTTDATLAQYLSLALPPNDEDVLAASQDSASLALPMRGLEGSLRAKLKLQDANTFQELLSSILIELVAMNLIEPAQQVHGQYEVAAYSPEHRLYFLKPRAFVLAWGESGELMQGEREADFSDSTERAQYWSALSTRFTSKITTDAGRSSLGGFVKARLDQRVSDALNTNTTWFSTYRMIKPHRGFFLRCIELGKLDPSVLGNVRLLQKLGFAGVAPVSIVKRFLMRYFKVTVKSVRRVGGSSARSLLDSRPSRLSRTRERPSTSDRATQLPLTKRRHLRIQREARRAKEAGAAQFDRIINEFMREEGISEEDQEVLRWGLSRARTAYAVESPTMRQTQMDTILDGIRRLNHSGKSDSYKSFVRQTTAPRTRRLGSKKKARQSGTEPVQEEEGEAGGRGKRSRKSGMDWTPFLDETLRDCGVILRARDKYRHPMQTVRKNWSALTQIFPSTNLAFLHNRFAKLQSAVGEEAYLSLLEAEWTALWTEYRGTEDLPDDDPKSATRFNLQDHLDFLQQNIDKNELLNKLRTGTGEALPLHVSHMSKRFDVERPAEAGLIASTLDSLTDHHVAVDPQLEMRGENLVRQALTDRFLDASIFYSAAEWGAVRHAAAGSHSFNMASCIVKMILGTNESDYNASQAGELCKKNVSDEEVGLVSDFLKKAQIAKERSSEGRQIPTRNLIYTDAFLSFVKPTNLKSLPIWQALSALPTKGTGQQSSVLTLFRNDADAKVASSILLVDMGIGQANVDTTPIREFSRNRLFNAKKTTDAELELPVHVKLEGELDGLDRVKAKLASLIEEDAASEGVLNWLLGVQEIEQEMLSARWKEQYRHVMAPASTSLRDSDNALRLMSALHEAGTDGLTRSNLAGLCNDDCSIDSLATLIDTALRAEPPLAFAAGFDEARLVSPAFLGHWTIALPDTPFSGHDENRSRFVIPRSWLDIFGQTNRDFWHNSIALFLHAIYSHPGVSLGSLSDHLRIKGAFARQDVYRLLRVAQQAGLIQQSLSGDPTVAGSSAFWHADSDDEIALHLALT